TSPTAHREDHHVAGGLVAHARYLTLRLPATWPWATTWPGRSRGCGPCSQPRGWPGHLTVLTAPATAAHTTRPRTAPDPQALSASVSRPASATSTSRRSTGTSAAPGTVVGRGLRGSGGGGPGS